MHAHTVHICKGKGALKIYISRSVESCFTYVHIFFQLKTQLLHFCQKSKVQKNSQKNISKSMLYKKQLCFLCIHLIFTGDSEVNVYVSSWSYFIDPASMYICILTNFAQLAPV